MSDLYFTIIKDDLLDFIKYCKSNKIMILNTTQINNRIKCKICCELFAYKQLKTQSWKV